MRGRRLAGQRWMGPGGAANLDLASEDPGMIATPRELTDLFLAALAENKDTTYGEILAEDAILRWWGWDGQASYRPRPMVIKRLLEEWSAWSEPAVELVDLIEQGTSDKLQHAINKESFLTLTSFISFI